jgi:hypothetical protein
MSFDYRVSFKFSVSFSGGILVVGTRRNAVHLVEDVAKKGIARSGEEG